MPTYVGQTTSSNSDTCAFPSGSVGDVIIYAVKGKNPVCDGNNGIGWSAGVHPLLPSTSIFIWSHNPAHVVTDCNWAWLLGARELDGTEPASVTFVDILGNPMTTPPEEIVFCLFTDIHPTTPFMDFANRVNYPWAPDAQSTEAMFYPLSNTTETLMIASLAAEDQCPPTPSGYTSIFEGSRTRIAIKAETTIGQITVPSVTLSPADAWGTSAISLTGEATVEPPEPGYRPDCNTINDSAL